MFSNELLFLLEILLDFSLLIGIYRHLGSRGLYVWIPFATVLANLQVLKTIELFGMTATLGNVLYASTYLATDILSERHSAKDAHTAVFIGFWAMVATIPVMGIALLFQPCMHDTASTHLQALFGQIPRVTIASFSAYLCSQFLDIRLFHLFKNWLPERRWLWVRNNAATIISQLVDTLIFAFIAFYGKFPAPQFQSILITTFLFKAIIALFDTPFVYLATGSSFYKN